MWNSFYTPQEQECINETLKHITVVRSLIFQARTELLLRAVCHDSSKVEEPELSIFAEVNHKLKALTYGSEEYHENLKAIQPALEHHYASNRHHPEHFENGVDGMNLIDLLEMAIDWYAATLRHHDGDINKSIEINEKRFNLSPQLVSILRNTVPLLQEWHEADSLD